MGNRNRRESVRVGALVLLLTVVGVGGGAWTDEVAAQELVLSRTPAAVQANAGLPGGKDMLMAVGTLQFLGLVVFEAMAFMRRRQQRQRVVATPLVFSVPVPAHISHRQAA